MFGAFLSAISLMNSGTGPAAAMSYPLGVHFGVPHGIGGGIFLPHVIEHNINSGFIDYAELYETNNSNGSNSPKGSRWYSERPRYHCSTVSSPCGKIVFFSSAFGFSWQHGFLMMLLPPLPFWCAFIFPFC